MKYRNLRIAWSVTWGVAAVLLIVLWVRSYQKLYVVVGPKIGTEAFAANSMPGMFIIRWESQSDEQPWAIVEQSTSEWREVVGPAGQQWSDRWGVLWAEPGKISIPYWLAALTAVACSCVPTRFSLRTLLIATTLIAVLLGLIVWLTR